MNHVQRHIRTPGWQKTNLFWRRRLLSLSFLLFCITVYWAAALRACSVTDSCFTGFASTVPLVVGAVLWLALQCRFNTEKLWSLFLLLLFLSLSIAVSGLHGYGVILLSVWLLAGAIAFVIAAGLQSLQQQGPSLTSRWLLLRLMGVVLLWLLMLAVFLQLRHQLGWLLAIRFMLLIPAIELFCVFRWRGGCGSNIMPSHVFSGVGSLLPLAALMAGLVGVLLSLLSGFITKLQGGVNVHLGVMLAFLLATFTLLPIPKRHAHYLLPLSALALLLAGLVYRAQAGSSEPSVWMLMALLAGIGLGGCLQVFQARFQDQQGLRASSITLLQATLGALLLLMFYPLIAHCMGSAAAHFFAPLLLLPTLLATFFVTKQ